MGLRWVPSGAEMGYECVWGQKWVGLGNETGLKLLVMACILSKMGLKQKHMELRMRIVGHTMELHTSGKKLRGLSRWVLKSVSPEQLMTVANAIDAAKEYGSKDSISEMKMNLLRSKCLLCISAKMPLFYRKCHQQELQFAVYILTVILLYKVKKTGYKTPTVKRGY
nr:hypothetical protein [Tanacetum cinerariifolium]